MHTRVRLCVIVSALLFSCLAFAGTDQSTMYMAQFNGSVAVNGVPQTSGSRVLTAGDVLESGSRSGATIVFGPGEVVAVDQDTTVRLTSGARGAQVELRRGRVQVNGSQSRLQDVRLAGRSISVEGQPKSQYLVSRLPQGDFVYAKLGRVSMREELLGVTTEIPEGRVGSIAEPAGGAPPQSGADHAGKVAASVPSGYIMRASQKTTNNSGDDVRWNDEMVTEAKGRTRVTLDDGSILSLGSNSHMKVVQHDANAQQTQLELTVGRMRVQAQKLTKSGASFTVKTPTATAGVIGTDFFIEYDAKAKRTKVVVLEGVVKLTPIAAAVAVSVLAGQTSAVAGNAASAPVSASASQMSSASSSTSASSSAGAAAAGASTAVITAATVAPVAATAIIVTATNQGKSSPTTP